MSGCGDVKAADRAARARASLTSQQAFFDEHWPRLVRYLKARASNTRFAEDAASEAITASLDNWDGMLTYQRPDSWLFKVATRMLLRLEARARHEGWLDESRASSDADLRIDAFRDDWVENYIDLISAVRSLPRRQCEVIALHYFGDQTIADTAQILDMSVATAKVHRTRGLAALRRHFGVAPIKTKRRIPA